MNRQAYIQAMRATLFIADEYGMTAQGGGIPECEIDHLRSMLQRVCESTEWSDGKMGRWLGWMQACVVMNLHHPDVDLETMKDINFHAGLCGPTVDQAKELGRLALDLSARKRR